MSIKRITYALAVLLLLTAIAWNVPSTRAAMEAFTRKIGTLVFNVTDAFPGSGEKSEIVIHESEKIDLKEARTRYPHEFNLPTWLPEGCIREPMVVGYYTIPEHAVIDITWRSAAGTERDCTLGLSVRPRGVEWVVGENAIEETTVNGAAAALVRGGWDMDNKSYHTGITTQLLVWEHGEIQYTLLTSFPTDITAEELIQIAESIP